MAIPKVDGYLVGGACKPFLDRARQSIENFDKCLDAAHESGKNPFSVCREEIDAVRSAELFAATCVHFNNRHQK